MLQKVFIPYLLFPLALAIAVAVGISALFTSVDRTFYNIAVFLILMVSCIAFERFLPYSRLKVSSQRLRAEIAVTLINVLIVAKIGELVLFRLFNLAAAEVWTIPPNLGPIWLQVILSILLIDFVRYWIHRWQHRIHFLWRLHAIHHSIPQVNALNGLFAHPFDFFLRNIFPMFFPFLVGVDVFAWFLATIILTVLGSFPHVNIPLNYGFLEWLFCSPKLHRWHHSEKADESNTNFGVGLIIFDRIFGTLFNPKDREAPKIMGLEGVTIPVNDIKELIRLPRTKYL